MSDARDAVLGRVRAALGPSPRVPDVPREYVPAGARGSAGAPEAVERFCERVGEYRATVHRVGADGLADALAAACARLGAQRLVAAPEPPARPPGVELVPDDPPLEPAALDGLDGALTGCALAIAETGTIVLDGGPRSGRRAITLVPDLHLCVVEASQVVPAVPDAIAALAAPAREGRPLTLVSGPSATSDIELDRVEGVHGPRTLEVFVVGQ
jgi:L-lactate dehydrogenase complex protein LldG